MTRISVVASDDTLRFDLSMSNSAYGAAPLKSLGGDVWGLYAGDESADGQVTATDFNQWLVDTKKAATGYLSSDFNLDGQVTAGDFNLWLSNTKSAASSKVP